MSLPHMIPSRLLLLALALGPLCALAQRPPNAGQLLQQVTPPPRLPSGDAPPPAIEESPAAAAQAGGQRFKLEAVRLGGNSAFTEQELQALVQNDIGRAVGLADLDALARRITLYYRQRGYLVARAYVPAQEVRAGIVHIEVLEGRIGQVAVDNRVGVAPGAIAPLGRLHSGESVDSEALEDVLLRLADLPGVEVKSTLRPGATVGTSDFFVELMPGRAISGSVEADTFGNYYTGAFRAGATFNWNNPARLGDQLSLRAIASGEDFQYGRIGYQLPFGAQATRVGVAWSQMRYRLGEELAVLDAHGQAQVASVYLQHPLRRSRQANWYATLEYDDKRLTDQVDATAFVADKSVRNVTLGLAGDFVDGVGGGGANNLNVSYTNGRLSLDVGSAAIDAASARSAGGFGKWALAFQRQQLLPAGWTLLVNLNGQVADRNLDSSEKLVLGGATGVRAYAQGEATGDDGAIVNLEARRALAPAWEAAIFYDRGDVRFNHVPWVGNTDTHRSLAGWGAGLAYGAGPWRARLFSAWKAGTGDAKSAPDRSPRVWAQAGYAF
jgi:hemolysin activation/secretion protein